MIRLAQDRDHGQLKALWTQVFGDAPQEVEADFALRHQNENMLVWAQEDRIQGMLSMLPLTLIQGKEAYPARYIYAVATAPEQRGRGIAGLLLERAGELIRARGEAAATLVPASDSLFNYYARRGYHTAFSLNVVDFDAASLAGCPQAGLVLPCAGGEYTRVRDRAFSQSGLYARWEEEAVEYALHTLGDGGAALLNLEGGEGVAAWSPMEGGVLVKELALVGISVPQALALLHRQIGAPWYRVRLAAGTQPEGKAVPFGMIRWLIPQPASGGAGYLSLALD